VMDEKEMGGGNRALNTVGVGAISPNGIISKDINKKIEEDILGKISKALREENLEYRGILFIGLMIDKEDINILEFNVRFGDPETEAVLLRLKSDLVDIILKTIDKTIEKEDLVWDKRSSVSLVTTSEGYPEKFQTGFKIIGLDNFNKSPTIFHKIKKTIEKEELI